MKELRLNYPVVVICRVLGVSVSGYYNWLVRPICRRKKEEPRLELDILAALLFQVLAERHEKGPVIITTNLGFADWTQIFGDPIMTAALLDRLTHRAHIIACNWESYRLKQSLKDKS